jgi:hypothetical protein
VGGGFWYINVSISIYHPSPCHAGIIIITTTIMIEETRVMILYNLRFSKKRCNYTANILPPFG